AGTAAFRITGPREPPASAQRNQAPAMSTTGVCQRRKWLPVLVHCSRPILEDSQACFKLDSRAIQLSIPDRPSAKACRSTVSCLLPGENGTDRSGSTRGASGGVY